MLFDEKLELFARSSEGTAGHLGAARAARRSTTRRLSRRPTPGSLTTWIGVGGSPESVVRAARYGLPLMLAIIGGEPARFAPLRRPLPPGARRVRRSAELPIGVHSPGYVADTDEQARGALAALQDADATGSAASAAGRPMTRAQFDPRPPDGALFVGSPETVAAKIVRAAQTLGLSRFDLKYSNGTLPHEHLMQHRALRHRGHAAGPRTARLTSLARVLQESAV